MKFKQKYKITKHIYDPITGVGEKDYFYVIWKKKFLFWRIALFNENKGGSFHFKTFEEAKDRVEKLQNDGEVVAKY